MHCCKTWDFFQAFALTRHLESLLAGVVSLPKGIVSPQRVLCLHRSTVSPIGFTFCTPISSRSDQRHKAYTCQTVSNQYATRPDRGTPDTQTPCHATLATQDNHTSKTLERVSQHMMRYRRGRDIRVDTSIILAIIRDLGPSTPHDLATRGDQSQLAHVDLEDCPLGQNAKLGVHGVLGVLLDGDDGQLNRDSKLGVSHVGLLIPQPHRADEALVLDGSPSEIGAHCSDRQYPLSCCVHPRAEDVYVCLSNVPKVGFVIILFHPFFAVFFPVFTTLNISSSAMPLTFGNGTLNFAAFSARLFLIALDRALAFVVCERSSRYCGSGVDDGSEGAEDLTLRSSWALICFFIWIFSAWRFFW